MGAEVDAAILVASTQSRRQRIQRIGRTLRWGEDGKRPLVITLFCQETRDETVIQNDREVFADVATFHETAEEAWVKVVRGCSLEQQVHVRLSHRGLVRLPHEFEAAFAELFAAEAAQWHPN